jgi:hypothetical protein
VWQGPHGSKATARFFKALPIKALCPTLYDSRYCDMRNLKKKISNFLPSKDDFFLSILLIIKSLLQIYDVA